jgi:hypothetical protein
MTSRRRTRLVFALNSFAGVQVAVLLVAAAVFGCGSKDGSPSEPAAKTLTVTASGRLERGSTITISTTRDGIGLSPSAVTLTASPATAAQIGADGSVTLLTAGAVRLAARSGGDTGSVSLTVALPPTVVFDNLVAGNRDIYAVALDGRDLVRLTTSLGDDHDPTTSGSTVVFVSYRDGNGELYSVPLAGGAEHRLTTTGDNEEEPAISSTASRLAFARSVQGTVAKLWTSAPDGSGALPLAGTPGGANSVEATPSWSPLGDRLAFLSTASGPATVYVYSFAGAGGATAAATGAPPNVEPAWSRDNARYIAFASDRSGDTELYLLDLQTSAVTRLTNRPGVDAQPAWSADGRLVYVAYVNAAARLRWLDPALPTVTHEIATGSGEPAHPALP